jgi:ferredoxin
MDCIDTCKHGAIDLRKYSHSEKPAVETTEIDESRRNFLGATAVLAGTVALKAQEKKVDGGLAMITDKKVPERKTYIVPPGAEGHRNLNAHCTACQLCISVCPNGVLRPSTSFDRFMQPESSYERGYCRPECTKCSEVCPTGAIKKITVADKTSIQIGHAVWLNSNCVPLTDNVECGNCARHCPVGAIQMVPFDSSNDASVKIPIVDTERCLGCGACENLCPSRPFSAIYVEGHERHRSI